MERYEIRYYDSEYAYKTGYYICKQVVTSRVAAVNIAQSRVKHGPYKFFDVRKIED